MKALNRLVNTFLWKVGTVTDGEKGKFPYGNCIVSYTITESSNNVEVWNPQKDTYLDNVAQALNEIQIPREETSEFNLNGFRDEADYARYRF